MRQCERRSKSYKSAIADENLRKEMGKRSRKMGEELFDRRITYNKIIDIINNMFEEDTV